MRMRVQSLGLLSVLRIRRCHELWCRSQMQLGFGIAMAQIQPLALELLYALPPTPQKKKKKKKKKKKWAENLNRHFLKDIQMAK